jgi:hypothetical protein
VSARVSAEKLDGPGSRLQGVAPLSLKFVWGSTRERPQDGWCSLCRGPAPKGAIVYKATNEPFDPEEHDHHIFCAACAARLIAVVPVDGTGDAP